MIKYNNLYVNAEVYFPVTSEEKVKIGNNIYNNPDGYVVDINRKQVKFIKYEKNIMAFIDGHYQASSTWSEIGCISVFETILATTMFHNKSYYCKQYSNNIFNSFSNDCCKIQSYYGYGHYFYLNNSEKTLDKKYKYVCFVTIERDLFSITENEWNKIIGILAHKTGKNLSNFYTKREFQSRDEIHIKWKFLCNEIKDVNLIFSLLKEYCITGFVYRDLVVSFDPDHIDMVKVEENKD